MPVTAVNPKETKEQRLAKLLEELEGFFAADGRYVKLEEKVGKLAEMLGESQKIDLKKVCEEVERNKAGMEKLAKMIRTSKGGFYVPGLEDQSIDIHKTLVAIARSIKAGGNHKYHFETCGAGKEFEILKAVEHKKYEVYTEANLKSQQVGDDSLGGFFIPDQVIADVITRIYTRSAFIALQGDEGTTRVSVLEGLTGGNVKIPKFDGGIIAFWVGEEDAIAESMASTAMVTMTPKKLGCLVRITETMMLLQGFGFDAMLRTDMIRALAKKLDYTVAYGKGGDNEPRGIAINPDIKIFQAQQSSGNDISDVVDPTTVSNWPEGDLDFTGLAKMELAFEEDDVVLDNNFAFVSAPRYFTRLKNYRVKEYSGALGIESPFIVGMPMLTDAKLRDIVGDYGKSTQIKSNLLPGASIGGATTSTNQKFTDVFAANFGEVVLGRWAGIEIADDGGKGKYFASGQTLLRMVLHTDLQIRQPRAVMLCPNAKARD